MAKLVSFDCLGEHPVYDLTVEEHHNFIANGVVVHNCMQVAQQLSGFSPGESYKFVKTIAKKIPEKMAALKPKFISGAQGHIDAGECTLKDVEVIWSLLETFAGYGFNKSHATAYSAVSTAQLWLKHNFLPEYMCALISNTDPGKKKHGSSNIMVNYINYARRRGVEVLGPHVNKSREGFTMNADGAIRFSMSHIKFVASKAAVIESFQPIESIEDFHERVKVTTIGKTGKKSSRRPDKRQVLSLIAADAFVKFGTRNEVIAEYFRVRKNKKDGEPPVRTDDKWVELEKEAIGLCLSREPLYKQHQKLIKQKKWTPIHGMGDRGKVLLFGQIEAVTPHTSRAGNSMLIVSLGDGLDTMKFFVFKAAMEFFRDNVKIGAVGAFPMDKFDDSETRFFDDKRDIQMLE